ncbi:MAG: hypothetical protein SGI77_17905 [Pirellulaceae bacterium]|nr:hypothetical protein [Pirellulaceae bacterium]
MNEPDEESDAQQNPYAPQPNFDSRPRLSPSLSVPLAVALVVFLAIASIINIGLGIALAILAIPAYIRAASSSVRKARLGMELSTSDRVLSFIASMGVVIASVIAGCIGLFVTCWGVLFANGVMGSKPLIKGDIIITLAFAVSVAGFIIATGIVLWLFSPSRRRP